VKHERAEEVDELRLSVGESVELESLRQAVVPPYLMLMPFVEAPDALEVERQDRLDEDGVHGSVFRLRGARPGHGELVVGFRDLRTKEVTHRKAISVAVDGGEEPPG
jgi:hypothetical protein